MATPFKRKSKQSKPARTPTKSGKRRRKPPHSRRRGRRHLPFPSFWRRIPRGNNPRWFYFLLLLAATLTALILSHDFKITCAYLLAMLMQQFLN